METCLSTTRYEQKLSVDIGKTLKKVIAMRLHNHCAYRMFLSKGDKHLQIY